MLLFFVVVVLFLLLLLFYCCCFWGGLLCCCFFSTYLSMFFSTYLSNTVALLRLVIFCSCVDGFICDACFVIKGAFKVWLPFLFVHGRHTNNNLIIIKNYCNIPKSANVNNIPPNLIASNSERFSTGKQYVICLSETCNGLWSLSYQVQKHGDNNESYHICRLQCVI